MIVYRHCDERLQVRDVLARHRSVLTDRVDGETCRNLLVEFGHLEAGLVDALRPGEETPSPTTVLLRDTTLHLARAYVALRSAAAIGDLPDRLQRNYARLGALALPDEITATTPEGFAWYGLDPQAYITAAENFAADTRPGKAVCVGLRSIGTTLSAVVAAVLEHYGWQVRTETLRPRGHPFERRPQLAPELSAAWNNSTAFFLVVDEGPGLSGSSLCGTAEVLSELGIPDERIVFFPSWSPIAEQLSSQAARLRWNHHRRYVAAPWVPDFLRVARDISGGAWRSVVYESEETFPPVHPQHERRKYLLECGGERRLYRFAGLAQHGAAKHERGLLLTVAGFIPAVTDLRDGYLGRLFVDGNPLHFSQTNRELLDVMAHYLAFLRRRLATPAPLPQAQTTNMAIANARETLGQAGAECMWALARQHALKQECAVALDGRMLPHEWLHTAQGYLKTDALDHHADHFFPGCNDIAWDVATVIEEFRLVQSGAQAFCARYAELSGDRTLMYRLPFYRAAYLAFRIGYAQMAAHYLGGTPDGRRFAELVPYYRARLAAALGLYGGTTICL